MEFNFNINNLLADTITRLDNTITPARRNAEGYSQHTLRSQLMMVIDQMGEASSQAQGLHTVITTARKLQLSDHILYIMKDSSGGRGSAVGILKIGHKKLFVYNHHGNVQEIEPLCVLDFYVHESRQRMGCGRQLFDHMLQDQNVQANHLAIDKPSFKFSQFLNKHYNLRAEIPQVNNFVVFEGFFHNRNDSAAKKRASSGKPPSHPSRRRDLVQDDGMRRQNTYNGYGMPLLPTATNQPLVGTSSRPTSGTSVLSGKANSASALSTPRRQMEVQRNGQLRPISATNGNDKVGERVLSAQALKTQGQQMYSRHISASPGLNGSRPSSNTRLNPSPVNKNQNATYSEQHAPLHPHGVTENYIQNLNLHHDYQGRRGHLKPRSTLEQPIRNPFLSREEEMVANAQMAGNQQWAPSRDQKSWTVFNKPPGYLSIAQRNYTHTRLW